MNSDNMDNIFKESIQVNLMNFFTLELRILCLESSTTRIWLRFLEIQDGKIVIEARFFSGIVMTKRDMTERERKMYLRGFLGGFQEELQKLFKRFGDIEKSFDFLNDVIFEVLLDSGNGAVVLGRFPNCDILNAMK